MPACASGVAQGPAQTTQDESVRWRVCAPISRIVARRESTRRISCDAMRLKRPGIIDGPLRELRQRLARHLVGLELPGRAPLRAPQIIRRSRRPGADREHVDAARRELEPQRLGERQQERLRGAVGRDERRALEGGQRREQHDAAAAARRQPAAEAVRQRERPAHVHVDRRELLRERNLEEGAARRERRVVDDEPDVEIGDGLLERGGGIRAREIERDATHLHRRESERSPARPPASPSLRRATSTRCTPRSASARANAAPIPSDAPAISAHGP